MENKQRFSLRKYKFGLASVLLGVFFSAAGQTDDLSTQVLADDYANPNGTFEVHHEDFDNLTSAQQNRIIPEHVNTNQLVNGVYTLVYQDELGQVYGNTALPATGEQSANFYQLLLSGVAIATGFIILRKSKKSKNLLVLTLTLAGMAYSTTVAARSALSMTEFVIGTAVKAKNIPEYHYIGYFVDPISNQAVPVNFKPVVEGGGSQTQSVNTKIQPTVSLNPITGDNYLDFNEMNGQVTVTGSISDIDGAVDKTVIISVNGKTFTAVVNPDNTFTADIPGSHIANAKGVVTAIVTVTDISGEPSVGVGKQVVELQTVTPVTIELDPITGDGIIEVAEAGLTSILVSGHVKAPNGVQSGTVEVEIYDYHGTWQVNPDGTFSGNVPIASILKGSSITASGTITDSNGQTYGGTVTRPYTKEPGATLVPTPAPTEAPTLAPTELPTEAPTEAPTLAPTEPPTETPTEAPTLVPTEAPTPVPTEVPTLVPTEAPTLVPTEAPTLVPTEAPTLVPTEAPTLAPTELPTPVPTETPTLAPTELPTPVPTETPTQAPTEAPTPAPTELPTLAPTEAPTPAPTEAPTLAPTEAPTPAPTEAPTLAPTEAPTPAPTELPTPVPTEVPTLVPTEAPTLVPTEAPTLVPTEAPTLVPTEAPTLAPTELPTPVPTEAPTLAPTEAPTPVPTETPTLAPTELPTPVPTETPTLAPTEAPTLAPTEAPTPAPTELPTLAPTEAPTLAPTELPTPAPTELPTLAPTEAPTPAPTEAPTLAPTEAPTPAPTPKPQELNATVLITEVDKEFTVNLANAQNYITLTGTATLPDLYAKYQNDKRIEAINIKVGDEVFTTQITDGADDKHKTITAIIDAKKWEALKGQAIAFEIMVDKYAFDLDENGYQDFIQVYGGIGNALPEFPTSSITLNTPQYAAGGVNAYTVAFSDKAPTVKITGRAEGSSAKAGDTVTLTIGGQTFTTTLNNDLTFSADVDLKAVLDNAGHEVKAVLTTADGEATDTKVYIAPTVTAEDGKTVIKPEDRQGDAILPYWMQAVQVETDYFNSRYTKGHLDKSPLGHNRTLQYHFISAGESGAASTAAVTMSEDEKQVIREVLALIAKYTGLQFTESRSKVAVGDGVNIYMDDMSLGGATSGGGTVLGYARFGLDLHLNKARYSSAVKSSNTMRGEGFTTALHELFHSFGLKHPFYEGNQYNNATLDRNEERALFTIMSYTQDSFADKEVMRPIDMAYMHYRYGVNANTRSGDDTYGFKTFNKGSYDGDTYIWDGSGVDTFDARDQSQGVYVNLTPGSWIYSGTKSSKFFATATKQVSASEYFGKNIYGAGNQNFFDNVMKTDVDVTYTQGQAFIGFNTQLENLFGSDHDDILIGNDANNVIHGGAGNDKIAGGKGENFLYGGDGNDIFVFDSPLGGALTTIADFKTGDKIQLSTNIFTSLTAGMANVLSMINYDQGTGLLTYQGTQFAKLANKAALTNADFVITAEGIIPRESAQDVAVAVSSQAVDEAAEFSQPVLADQATAHQGKYETIETPAETNSQGVLTVAQPAQADQATIVSPTVLEAATSVPTTLSSDTAMPGQATEVATPVQDTAKPAPVTGQVAETAVETIAEQTDKTTDHSDTTVNVTLDGLQEVAAEVVGSDEKPYGEHSPFCPCCSFRAQAIADREAAEKGIMTLAEFQAQTADGQVSTKRLVLDVTDLDLGAVPTVTIEGQLADLSPTQTAPNMDLVVNGQTITATVENLSQA